MNTLTHTTDSLVDLVLRKSLCSTRPIVARAILDVAASMASAMSVLGEAIEAARDSLCRGYGVAAEHTLAQALAGSKASTSTSTSASASGSASSSASGSGSASITVSYQLDGPQSFTCSLVEARRLVASPAAGMRGMRIKAALREQPMVRIGCVKSKDLLAEVTRVAEQLDLLGRLSCSDHDGGWGKSAVRYAASMVSAAGTGTSSIGEVRSMLEAGVKLLTSSGSGLARRIHATYVMAMKDTPSHRADVMKRAVRTAVLAQLTRQWKQEAGQRHTLVPDMHGVEQWVTSTGRGCPVTAAPPLVTPGPFETPYTDTARALFRREARKVTYQLAREAWGAQAVYRAVAAAQNQTTSARVPTAAWAPSNNVDPELTWYKISGRYEMLPRQQQAHVRAWKAELYQQRLAVVDRLRQLPGLLHVKAHVGTPCLCRCGRPADVSWPAVLCGECLAPTA